MYNLAKKGLTVSIFTLLVLSSFTPALALTLSGGQVSAVPASGSAASVWHPPTTAGNPGSLLGGAKLQTSGSSSYLTRAKGGNAKPTGAHTEASKRSTMRCCRWTHASLFSGGNWVQGYRGLFSIHSWSNIPSIGHAGDSFSQRQSGYWVH